MNRLIIVGNGFDLSLGLETSYNHFLISYIKNNIRKLLNDYKKGDSTTTNKKHGEVIQYNDELISLRVPVKFQPDIQKDEFFTKLEEFESFVELSKYLQNEGILSFKFELLMELYSNSSLGNWIDVEVLYYDKMISKFNQLDKNKREENVRNLNRKFNFLRLRLIDYLTDIEVYYNDTKFQTVIQNYISKWSEPLILEGNKIEINHTMFVNFNYTPTLSNSLKMFRLSDYTLVPIHGELEEPDSVIFGFGDELDKNYQIIEYERTQEYFKNIKSVHYFKYPYYKKLKSFIDSNDFDVHVVGHSCGISDRTLLNEIFENELCRSVKIYHYRRNSKETDFEEKSIEIMRHFTDKKGMRGKVQTFDLRDNIPQLKK